MLSSLEEEVKKPEKRKTLLKLYKSTKCHIDKQTPLCGYKVWISVNPILIQYLPLVVFDVKNAISNPVLKSQDRVKTLKHRKENTYLFITELNSVLLLHVPWVNHGNRARVNLRNIVKFWKPVTKPESTIVKTVPFNVISSLQNKLEILLPLVYFNPKFLICYYRSKTCSGAITTQSSATKLFNIDSSSSRAQQSLKVQTIVGCVSGRALHDPRSV